MPPRKELTREERLEKKRQVEKLRYQQMKNDPEKYSQQKEKEKIKYERKKDKGTIKPVSQMTPKEQRKARKIWREKARLRRRRLALQKKINNDPVNPPNPDNEVPLNENINQRAQAIYILLKKKAAEIAKLKSKLQRYEKRLERFKKERTEKQQTPNSKVNALLNSPISRDTVKEKILYGEVLSQQLRDNKLTLIEAKRNTRQKSCQKTLSKTIENFMEENSNSRMCAGTKDVVTKQKRVMLDTLVNLHELFMKETNIKISYALFCKLRPFWVVQSHYDKRDTYMCIKHSNIDFILKCLHQAKIISVSSYVGLLNTICCNRHNENCLSRNCETCRNNTLCYKEFDNSLPLFYKKWQSVPQDYVDLKTKMTRTITRCLKSTIQIYPQDLILELESNTKILLRHEFNIVHQYMALKSKKETLTDQDAIIHVDFSKNYQTKYAEEVQSFHFGGSREQISLHTVVVYTKDNNRELQCSCYCTLSKNLSHSPPAIWAHLQPILDSLPPQIENLHFLSDGPVAQYRNKIMFHTLATKLQDFYPNLIKFTWNYHEAGHGKGAPDGVGATCKRTAARLVGTGHDISSLEDLTNALQKYCPNIKVLIIDDKEISKKEEQLENTQNFKGFSGTMKVHQISGSIFLPNHLTMKSLSCFCDLEVCNHFVLGTLDFATMNTKLRLNVDNGPEIASDDEPLINYRKSKQLQASSQDCSQQVFNKKACQGVNEQPSTSGSKNELNNGDFVLVRLLHKGTEYRYVAMCTGVEEDNEIQLIFCKIFDNTGKNFIIDNNDISFVAWDQIIDNLPSPNLKMKGQTIYYAFDKSINVFEQA